MNKRLKLLVHAAVIAAMYAAITLLTPARFLAYEGWQVRIAEALTLLPMVTPAAIPGLFVGCIIVNLFSPVVSIYDIVFGSLATLISA